jgi:acetyltransferase
VVLNITSEDELCTAWSHITAQWAKLPHHYKCDGYIIAEYMHDGLDLFMGCKIDSDVGPVIVFGSGGIDVELVNDSAIAALPLSHQQARHLIGRTKAGQKLRGLRATEPLHEQSVIDALIGLSHLMSDSEGSIAAIDINPFRVDTTKGLALDGVVIFADQKA